jgi:hypothetical protein
VFEGGALRNWIRLDNHLLANHTLAYKRTRESKENMVSNIVVLLERIGQSSQLHALGGEQLKQELGAAGVAADVQTAILQQHARRLEELIGASSNVCCLIHAPQDDEPDDAPQKDKEEVRNHGEFAQSADRRVASAA